MDKSNNCLNCIYKVKNKMHIKYEINEYIDKCFNGRNNFYIIDYLKTRYVATVYVTKSYCY